MPVFKYAFYIALFSFISTVMSIKCKQPLTCVDRKSCLKAGA